MGTPTMTDTLTTRQRNAQARTMPESAVALEEALEAERRRLAEAERNPAAEARANIAELEADVQRLAALDAERIAEQESLAGRWRELMAELAPLTERAAAIGRELETMYMRDLALASSRGAAAGDPSGRYTMQRLQTITGDGPPAEALEDMAARVRLLELVSDREAPATFVHRAAAPEPPHYPAGGDRGKPCVNDGQPWPCETAQAAMVQKERDELRWVEH